MGGAPQHGPNAAEHLTLLARENLTQRGPRLGSSGLIVVVGLDQRSIVMRSLDRGWTPPPCLVKQEVADSREMIKQSARIPQMSERVL
jgi:hypothetical protein